MRLVLPTKLIMYILEVVAQGININETYFYLPEHYMYRYKTISILWMFLVFENWITKLLILIVLIDSNSTEKWMTTEFYKISCEKSSYVSMTTDRHCLVTTKIWTRTVLTQHLMVRIHRTFCWEIYIFC